MVHHLAFDVQLFLHSYLHPLKVEVATSDGDFERRAEAMDMYNAVVVDPWTWAGKGKAKTVGIVRETGYHIATGLRNVL